MPPVVSSTNFAGPSTSLDFSFNVYRAKCDGCVNGSRSSIKASRLLSLSPVYWGNSKKTFQRPSSSP
jgi:hypothetical protein